MTRPPIRRRLRTPAATLSGVAVGVLLGIGLSRRTAAPAPASSSAPTDAEQALGRVLPEVDLEAVPFEQAVERVRRLGGVPLVVHHEALAAAGLDLRRPFSYRARNVALGDLLSLLASAASNESCRVGYAPAGEVVVISVAAELERNPFARAYDVRDLVKAAAGPPGDPVPGCFGPMPAPPEADSPEALVQLVQNVVAPDSWKENGGLSGGIRCFAGRLVVVQTCENHRQIAGLLAQLRESPGPPLPPRPGPDLMLWDARLKRYVSTKSDEGESALGRRLAEVRLEAVPLEQALASLAGTSGANLLPDWQPMEAAGIRRDEPVTLRLRDVTLADALRGLLQVAGRGRLAFQPDGAYVTITSREEGGKSTLTRVYDVRELIDRELGPEPAPGRPRADWRATKDSLFERVARLMEEQIAPDSWRDNGGQAGAVKELSGWLVVTQTWENHRRVADLLDALRTDPARHPLPATRPAPKTRSATTGPGDVPQGGLQRDHRSGRP